MPPFSRLSKNLCDTHDRYLSALFLLQPSSLTHFPQVLLQFACPLSTEVPIKIFFFCHPLCWLFRWWGASYPLCCSICCTYPTPPPICTSPLKWHLEGTATRPVSSIAYCITASKLTGAIGWVGQEFTFETLSTSPVEQDKHTLSTTILQFYKFFNMDR